MPTQNIRQADGTVTVLVAGTDLVDHDRTRASSPRRTTRWATPCRRGLPGAVEIDGGKLAGLIEMRDTTLAGYVTGLDTLARQIAEAVNAAHTSGVDANGNPGLALFTFTAGGAQASSLQVLPGDRLRPDAHRRLGGRRGPGRLVHRGPIAGLRTSATFGSGTQTPVDAYAGFIGQIGTDTRQASELAGNQALVVQQLQTRRESISGVSLDEEAADVMRFQQAYSASARVITAIDEMLDQLINRTGTVGW